MAARRKPKTIPVDADYGPPERHQHGVELVVVAIGPGKATSKAARAKYEHVLDRYLERDLIDRMQHEAGMKVRAYWELATLLPQNVSMKLDRGHGGHDTGNTPLAVINASSRLQEVRKRVSPEVYACLIAVCGHGEWATNAAPRHRAMRLMREGLDAAAYVWRM